MTVNPAVFPLDLEAVIVPEEEVQVVALAEVVHADRGRPRQVLLDDEVFPGPSNRMRVAMFVFAFTATPAILLLSTLFARECVYGKASHVLAVPFFVYVPVRLGMDVMIYWMKVAEWFVTVEGGEHPERVLWPSWPDWEICSLVWDVVGLANALSYPPCQNVPPIYMVLVARVLNVAYHSPGMVHYIRSSRPTSFCARCL